ncbi:AbrB family transcriptional regulator [Neomegalonema perideroedes]|uniref:AbrB family transcriptional regulator n=1 Tax=Neomegalonema perideroedes TaxID=217219 RepID=UPI00036DE9ED|nr:AbrB family transcriptional regulator [Neomegalonema perideroedes]
MTARALMRLAALLAAALAGGALAESLGLPAGWLLGATAASLVLAGLGHDPNPPNGLRDAAFLTLGVMLGSSVDEGTLQEAARWPASFVILAAAVVAMMVLGARLLRQGFGYDANTARLASAPGALSAVMATALSTPGCDVGRVALLQTLRLIVLVAFLPVALDAALPPPAALPAPEILRDPFELALVFAAGGLCGWLLTRIKTPAGYVIGGLLASMTLHLTGVVHGRPSVWFAAPAYVVVGALIGARFLGVTRAELRAAFGAAAALVVLLLAVGGIGAALASWASGVPFAQAALAFAPGGAEAMAVIGLTMGFEAAYVGSHHIARILALSLTAPFWLKR